MQWWSKLTLSKLLVVSLIILSCFLRVYNLKDSLQFQGDQGRDAMIVADIFKEKDPVFIGPVTSVGNMYLGPLYYYFMMPFLWLSYPSPMGPVYAVACLGILTVALVYYLGKKIVGEKAALWATAFYSLSSVVITYTRFSWNPNPAPLVSLLMIYWTYQAWQKKPWFWPLVSLAFAVLLQLHYLALLTAGGAGVMWLIDLGQRLKKARAKTSWQPLLKLLWPSLVALLVLLLSFTPLVLFDYKHNWLNLKAFQNLLFGEPNFKLTNSVSWLTRLWQIIKETHGRGMHILLEIAIGQRRRLNSFLLFAFTGLLGWRLLKKDKSPTHTGELTLMAYLLTSVIGTALYEHTIFDHYIAYLFPVTFLIYGVVAKQLSKRLWGKMLVWIFFGFFLWYNLPRLPLQDAGWTIDDMKRVSQTIYERVKPNEKYNLVLLSESRDLNAQNYRYFLTTTDRPPVETAERPNVEKLFIINEERQVKDPTTLPIYEIKTFPDKEPVEIYQVEAGPEILVLERQR